MSAKWILAAGVAFGMGLSSASAQESSQTDAKPVNENCPVSGRKVDVSVKMADVDGNAVGFCCPNCPSSFASWDSAKKAEFVRTAMASQPVAEWAGDPYTLATCPVSGESLADAGGGKTETIEGREIRFCCNDCIAEYKADPAKFTKAIDDKMIKDQLAYYPLTTCIISGEALENEGEHAAVNRIYKNRLVRFCCESCIKDFEKDPAAGIAKLDKAVAAAQRDTYPLKTCVVGTGELGSMGDPVEIVVANRLVRFCCGNCEPRLRKAPLGYLAAIDAAWKAQGMPKPTSAKSDQGG